MHIALNPAHLCSSCECGLLAARDHDKMLDISNKATKDRTDQLCLQQIMTVTDRQLVVA